VDIIKRSLHEYRLLPSYLSVMIRFRYAIFAIAILGTVLDAHTDRSFFVFYSLIMVAVGLVYRGLWVGIISSCGVTISRYLYSPTGLINDIEFFIAQWFSYFAIWLAVSLLVKKTIEQKDNLIKLTTILANTLDARDKYTAYHSDNVARYAGMIALEMKLPKKKCEHIQLAGKLHDIGKIGIPEHILSKPGKLTDDEFELIKKHPAYGYNMVKHIISFQSTGVLDAILLHHERENGTGYPRGLKGEEIPLVAKIIAVADSFDAMTSTRTYQKDQGLSYAIEELTRNKGTLYDVTVTEVFLSILHREGEGIFQRPI